MAEVRQAVRIWDLPTRLFHWTLAAGVVGSVVSAKVGGNAMEWHFRFGYAVFALLIFRLVWGIGGGRWSRFASFVRGPLTTWRYLRGQRGGPAGSEAGHNPLGALSVLGMLTVLGVQVGTGLFADDEIASTGPLVSLVTGSLSSQLTSWHKTFGQWLILGLVALHVSAILFYLFKKKRNLIGPMWTGDQVLPSGTPASADGWRQRLLALVALVACAAVVAWVIQQGAVASGV